MLVQLQLRQHGNVQWHNNSHRLCRSASAHTFSVPAAHGHPERRPEFDAIPYANDHPEFDPAAIHFADAAAVPITFRAAVGAPDDPPNWRADGAPDIGTDGGTIARTDALRSAAGLRAGRTLQHHERRVRRCVRVDGPAPPAARVRDRLRGNISPRGRMQ